LILGFIAACLGFVAFIPNAEAAIVIQAPKYIGLTNGLVGYWSFDGKDMAGNTAYDRSGNANNGTLTNGPTRAIGKIGQGLSFDGVARVDVGSDASLNILGPITISAWIKTSSVAEDAIFGAYNPSSPYQGYGFEIGAVTAGKLGYWSGGNGAWVESNSTVNDGVWHHAVVTVSGTTASFYKDGIVDGTPTTQVPNTVSLVRAIGAVSGGGGNWTGYIDDVRVYNRALSADEIKRLYRIGATLKINTSINNDSLTRGLVGYWSFNAPDIAQGGATTTVYDRSGNAKNGTFTGVDGSTDTIAVVGTPSTATFTTGNPINVSHTTGSGANFMVVGISITNDNFGSISSVTYNGDALTQACENQSDDDANAYIYYRVNPDVTTANVTVTLSTGAASGGVIGVMTFSGVNTTTPLGTCADSGVDEGTTINVDVTSATGELVFDVISTEDGNPTANASQTVRWDISANPVYAGASTKAGASTVTMQWTQTGGSHQIMTAMPIKPNITAAVAQPSRTIGRIGQAVQFDGAGGYINMSNVGSGLKTISFWMKGTDVTSKKLINIDGTDQIETNASDQVVATSFPAATVYVDGAAASTVKDNTWHQVVITDTTGVSGSIFELGRVSTSYFTGLLDDVRVYNRALSGDEIKRLYRIGATLKINTDVSRDNPDLNSGLVGYWSFDGKDMAGVTAYDRSGNANNGTLTNGPTRAIGKIGQGLSFDGSNDYVDAGTAASLNPVAVTVSAWIKFNSLANAYSAVWSRIGFTPSSYTQIFVKSNGKLAVYLFGSAEVSYDGTGSNTLSTGAWYFIVLTYDSTSGLKQYVNNALDASVAANGTLAAKAGVTASIGTDLNNGGRYFNGLIDDVRVYNRALSADEIKRLYNLGR